MIGDPVEVSRILLDTLKRIQNNENSRLLVVDVLKRTGDRVRDSRERLVRGRGDLERFLTLGCSTESQRAYRRSPAARRAARAIQAALSTNGVRDPRFRKS